MTTTERLNQEILELDAILENLINTSEIEDECERFNKEQSELSSLFAQADAIMSKEIYCD